MRIIRTLIGLPLLLASQLAAAFLNSPVLVTTNPIPGRPVIISITAGVCDSIALAPVEITRTDNNILMVVPTTHTDFSDYCIFPTGAVNLEIGTFAPGTYSLRVERSYISDNGPVIELIGALVFTVAAPASVPTLSLPALLALMLLFVATSAAFRWQSIVPPNYSFKRTGAERLR